jgi:hypothetical protein
MGRPACSKDPGVTLKVPVELNRVSYFLVYYGSGRTVTVDTVAIACFWEKATKKSMSTFCISLMPRTERDVA